MIVIGFTGLAGAGKSTAAAHLVARHGFQRRPFAGLLKGMLCHLLSAQGAIGVEIDRMLAGDLKEVPTPYFGGATPRRAMQLLGTEWGRALAPDLWVDLWGNAVASLRRVVADDVRFDNEAAAIRARGGVVVEIRRPGVVRIAGDHISERGVVPDLTILNVGTPEDLARDVASLLDLVHRPPAANR